MVLKLDELRFTILPADFFTAKANGISEQTVRNRVDKLGWDVDSAITKPVDEKYRPTGEWEKWKEIATQNGISYQNFRTRLSRGKTPFQAATDKARKPRGIAVAKARDEETLQVFEQQKKIVQPTYVAAFEHGEVGHELC